MKSGKTLVELAQEIQRQSRNKADYVTPTQSLSITFDQAPAIEIADVGHYGLTPVAHRQISGNLAIPADFYDRLLAGAVELRDPYEPGRSLYESTVNSLLQARAADERRLVRTLDGNARAFLSDRYRPLD